MLRRIKRISAYVLSMSVVFSSLITPMQVFADREAGSPHVIAEHGFEAGNLHGWQGRGGSTTAVEVSDEAARTGASSLKATGSTANWHGAGLGLLSVVEAGGTYSLSAYVQLSDAADEPGSLKLTVHSNSSSGEQYSQISVSNEVTSSGWVQLSGEYTVPEGLTGLNVIVESGKGDVHTPDFYLDDFSLTVVSPPPGSFEPAVIAAYDFEDGLQGWFKRGTETVTQSAYEPYEGEYSLLAEGRSDGWHGPGINLISTLKKGVTYGISAYVKVDRAPGDDTETDSTVKVTMENRPSTAADGGYTTVASQSLSAGVWVQLEGNFSYLEDKTTLVLYIESSNAQDLIWLDHVTITQLTPDPGDPSPELPELDRFVYDFETGEQGWGPRSAVVAVTDEASYEGDQSLRVTDRSASWAGAQIDLKNVLKKGAVYDISAHVRLMEAPDSPRTVKLSMQRTFEGEAQGWDTVDEQAVEITEWIQLKGSYSFDLNAEELTLYVESSEQSDDFYIDNVIIEMTQAPPLDQSGVRYDFEDGEAGDWFGRFNQELVEVSDADAYTGDYSLLTETFANEQGVMLDVTDKMHAGSTYTVTVWAKLAPGEEDTVLNLSVEQGYMGNSTYSWIEGNKTVTDDEWVKLSGTYSVATFADLLRIYIETYEGPGKFYIDDFSIVYNEPRGIQHDIPSLKEVFADYFEIGAAIETQHMVGSHGEMLQKHYNVIVAENVMKPASIQPSEGNFNWGPSDAIFEYAEEHGMKVRFHTLVWHSQAAEWMFLDLENKDMTKQEDPVKREANKELLMQRMKDHITAVVNRYKDRVDSWDVVNEAIADGGGMRTVDSKWWQVFESDIFIREAFKLVRELDPDAKLFINDYNTHSTAKRDTLYEKVVEWLEDGVPIDGVGHQTHINYRSPSVDSIIESIEMFGELGLDNQITELDINIYTDDIEAFPEYADIPEERHIAVAYRYKELFDALKALEETEDYISQVIFWGIADDHTWLHNRPSGTTRQNAPFVFDQDLQAKHAYWALVDPSRLPVPIQNLRVFGGAPEIDGNRDFVWDLVPVTEVSEQASFQTLWDEDSLYVLAEIDDVTASYRDQADIYIGDERYSLKRDESNVSGVDYAVKEIVDGYRIEAKLPLAEASEGQEVSFDIRFTDSSLSAPVSWNDKTNSQDSAAEHFGRLTLRAMPKVETAFRGTPEVDAAEDEIWADANVMTTGVWVEGGSGAVANVKTLWDDTHLYVWARVTDPLLDDSSANAHEQDSVEIFVDQNNAKTDVYQSDDGQYRVNYNNVRSYNGRASAANFTTSAEIVEGGYIVEASIALDEGISGHGKVLGFDVQVNDDADGDGVRDSVAIWNDPTGQSYQNTSNYGLLYLYDPTVVPEPEEEVRRPITDYPIDPPSGGGGVPTDSASPEIVAGNGSITVTVSAHADGAHEVELTDDTVRNALNDLADDRLRIRVNLPENGARSATVHIPLPSILEDGSGVQRIDVTVGGATVSIATDNRNGVWGEGAQQLTLSISEIDPETLPESVRERVDGFPVYDFGLQVDGVDVDRFEGQGAVAVEMDYTLRPGENPHQIVVYYIGSDDELVIVRHAKYDEETGKVTFSPRHFSRYAASLAVIEFGDMNHAAWAVQMVEALASREIVRGTGEDRFEPNRQVTRAEFLLMLMRSLDLIQSDGGSSFGDAVPGAWYYEALVSAERLGIVQGKGDGTFGVLDTVTRQDMAVMTYRAALEAGLLEQTDEEQTQPSFTDEREISAYALEAVRMMRQAGVLDGVGDGSFRPHGISTRADAAAIIYKLLGL